MLVTVSTVMDTPRNVRRFVTSNLAMGVDHMVIFVDAPQGPGQRIVAQDLSEHPHVTSVVTDAKWWLGRRPRDLNVRQRTNANLAIALVEDVAEVDWIVHIDGDEVAVVEPGALGEVPADVAALRLLPQEAVSQFAAEDAPVLFKSLLAVEDLQLLHVLGVLRTPTNQAYFHGHVLGKAGVRPTSGLRLALHDAVDPAGLRVAREHHHESPGLRVLHYNAVSGQQFVRKWRALANAGPRPVQVRPDRAPMTQAVHSLITKELGREVTDHYLRRIYELTTADDVETLGDLNLLQHIEPWRGDHIPTTFSAAGREVFDARLAELRDQPKLPFHTNYKTGPVHAASSRVRASPGVRVLARARRRLRAAAGLSLDPR